MLTPSQIDIGKALRRYQYLRTSQIRDIVAPKDKDAIVTRERLRGLLALGFVRRHQPCMIEPGSMTAPPIYVLTMKGSCELAAQTGDCSLILTVEPTFRDWMSLNHYCALADLHWKIDTAINAQSYVKQHGLYFEHEVICSSAKEPWKKYRLNTRVSDKLYCCPDSAFETEVNGCRRAWMVEREMGSDTPGRVMAKKHKGHHALAAGKLYQRWFPQAADMRVLAVCPNAGWRDLLRREFIERHGELTKLKPGAELWLFVDVHDVTPEKFLHEPIFYTVDRGPLPFVPRPAASPAGGA